MRPAVIVAPGLDRPASQAGDVVTLRGHVADRVANGDAFHGETVARLPRGLTRLYGRIQPDPYSRRSMAGWSRLYAAAVAQEPRG